MILFLLPLPTLLNISLFICSLVFLFLYHSHISTHFLSHHFLFFPTPILYYHSVLLSFFCVLTYQYSSCSFFFYLRFVFLYLSSFLLFSSSYLLSSHPNNFCLSSILYSQYKQSLQTFIVLPSFISTFIILISFISLVLCVCVFLCLCAATNFVTSS